MQLQLQELSEQDLSEVLTRAQAIQANKVSLEHSKGDLEMFIKAAEEVGINREALLQAIKEKSGQPLEGLHTGDKVFAKSADGAFYLAEVTELDSTIAKVSFNHGTTHTLPLTDLRPFSLLPGQKIEANWPIWGWWEVQIVRYDAEKQLLDVTDGMETRKFTLDEIRLKVEKNKTAKSLQSKFYQVAFWAATVGAVAGAILMRILSS